MIFLIAWEALSSIWYTAGFWEPVIPVRDVYMQLLFASLTFQGVKTDRWKYTNCEKLTGCLCIGSWCYMVTLLTWHYMTVLGVSLKNCFWNLLILLRGVLSLSHTWPGGVIIIASSICLSVHVCSGHCSEIIHDNSFIVSWQINLTWNLCTVRLFGPFDR